MATSLGCVVAVVFVLSCSDGHQALSDDEFAQLLVSFSEEARTFEPSSGYQSENWISNERSFQQVLPGLPRRTNGAYLGVGPEQNFTYIAAVAPRIAFIVDVRRENLALHLLYKALFEMSANRAEFLCRLFARRLLSPDRNSTDEVAALLTAVASSPHSSDIASATVTAVFGRLERRHDLRLADEDVRSIREAYARFGDHGPAIRWSSDDRRWIPTYAELMTETGSDGRLHSFLASEETFQTVKRLQQQNRIVPLVGDFGGKKTLAAISSYFNEHRLVLDVFYTSNVRPYLRGASLDQFELNLTNLPADDVSVVVETRFHSLGNETDKPEFETFTYAVPIRSH
jgi:hypothetical protein